MKIPIELEKMETLERDIPSMKGKMRDKAMDTYRQLLRLLKDEPIYLVRYE